MQNVIWVFQVLAVQVNKGSADRVRTDWTLSRLPLTFCRLRFIPEMGAQTNVLVMPCLPLPAAHNCHSLKELINHPATMYCGGRSGPLAFETAQCQPMSRPIPPFVFNTKEKEKIYTEYMNKQNRIFDGLLGDIYFSVY